MFTSTLLSLLLPALVSAHGYVGMVTIDAKDYLGNSVGTTPTIDSIIRQVDTNDPVLGATNPYLNCGRGPQLAAKVANANPGSTILVYWYGGRSGPARWPHNAGPIMHYMTKRNTSCANYDSSNAEWFKISEEGLQPDGRTWSQAELYNGLPATVTIPSNLAPGEYLLHSEIIALQNAMHVGGAEFYPSCIQLSVGGSETGHPTSDDEVTLPGAYSDTDPGIWVNVYPPPLDYVFPRPPIASFIQDSDSTNFSTGSGSESGPGSSNTVDGDQIVLA